MIRAHLHLVDTAGEDVRVSIKTAVEDAFRWIVRSFPLVDSALIANWAEDVAHAMEAAGGDLRNPGRYATVALHGKVRDWLKTGAAKLEPVGVGRELERLGGYDTATQGVLDRALLFEQLKATLKGRDQVILALLLYGCTDDEISAHLGVTRSAGRKAIQRMKERMSATLQGSRSTNGAGHRSTTLCVTKG